MSKEKAKKKKSKSAKSKAPGFEGAKTVQRTLPLIHLLTRIKNPKVRREILRAGEKQHLGQSICSMCKNMDLDSKAVRRLTPQQRKKIRLLGHGRLTREARDRHIVQQKGGALPIMALLSFAAPLLAQLLGGGN